MIAHRKLECIYFIMPFVYLYSIHGEDWQLLRRDSHVALSYVLSLQLWPFDLLGWSQYCGFCWIFEYTRKLCERERERERWTHIITKSLNTVGLIPLYFVRLGTCLIFNNATLLQLLRLFVGSKSLHHPLFEGPRQPPIVRLLP